MANKNILLAGSYASEYSLAKINRNLGFALADLGREQGFAVNFYAEENFVDRFPNSSDLQKYPQLKNLQTKTQDNSNFVIFNNFPKNPAEGYGLAKLQVPVRVGHIFWEESVYPGNFVAECNRYLHGIMVPSNHVLKVLRNSGIKIPIVNIGEGINLQLPELQGSYQLPTKKKFKFLHISSAHYRKGVDVMLKSYFQSFSTEDDVTLIIKLFPNPDSELQDILSELQKQKGADSPEVIVINNPDLSDAEIAAIIKQCHCLVAPSRAEGFGLPLAEAMLMRVPVITTNYSGQTDFCHEHNCYLLDYHMVDSKSQLFNPGAKLAEPDGDQLAEIMRRLYETGFSSAETKQKVAAAYATAAKMSWKSTAGKVLDFLSYAGKIALLKEQKLAVISTRNSICGIAQYSQEFYPQMEAAFKEVQYFANSDAGDRIFLDQKNVTRTWEYGETDFSKTIAALEKFRPDYVHIQYNGPFYSLAALSFLIANLSRKKIKILLTIHSLAYGLDLGKYRESLAKCTRIYVHSQKNLEILQKSGFKNAFYWFYGVNQYADFVTEKLRSRLHLENSHPVIASHGLIHDKKGLLEIITAINILREKYPEILFLSVNAVNSNNITSADIFTKMHKLVHDLHLQENVIFISEFLEQEEIIRLLQLADVLVLAYADLDEGASGAVRTAFSAHRPVITTESRIFSELPAGYRIKNNEPALIAAGIDKLLNDKDLAARELGKIEKFIKEYSWEKIGRDYLLELSGF